MALVEAAAVAAAAAEAGSAAAAEEGRDVLAMYCTFDLNLLSGPWKSKFSLHSY